jgi:1-acyl-sn-glycerol-3-phosphate acyltransferase
MKQSPYPSTCPFPAQQFWGVQPPDSAYRFGWFDWFCLWYPPGWLILFNRHWQHYHTDRDGWNWLEYLLFLIPGGFYLALLIRWVRLGFRAPRSTVDTIDPRYQQAFRDELLTPILQHYFRAELHQVENLPSSGRLLVALNHAGMCFPWDFLGLGVLLGQARGWVVQPVAHGLFFDHPWLRWWLPAGWSQVLGGVRAERDSFEAAVQAIAQGDDNTLLYAPEGWRGLAKGWGNRHSLTTFDPSFVKLSDRYQIPILPVVCLGSEWLHPWTYNVEKLARWLKLPLFPVSPLMVPFLLFPSMGVWAARSRLRYYIQPLEQPWQAHPETHLVSASASYRRAQALRSGMQRAIDGLRATVAEAVVKKEL